MERLDRNDHEMRSYRARQKLLIDWATARDKGGYG